MAEFKVNLSIGLLFSGSAWLEQWAKIPQPPPKKFDMPPRGAAGEAVITLQWAAEWALFGALLASRRDAGELAEDDFLAFLQQGPPWKELGGDAALKAAAKLPEKYRGILAHLLYVRHVIRGMYRDSRPAKATAPWTPNGLQVGAEPITTAFDDWPASFSPQPVIPAAATWILPVIVLGVAGMAASAWYGAKVAEAGVAIDAERAFAAAQAMRDVKIAQIQAAAGQEVTVPDFVSRGAQMEAAQSSPWTIGILAALGGIAAGAGLYAGYKTPRRSNPSRGRVKTLSGVPVQVVKYKSGFRAWVITKGKRTRSIDVRGAKSYEEAFGKAGYKLRKATVKKRNPKKLSKKKRAARRNPRKKRTNRKKANPKKRAKRKANPKHKRKANPKKRAKRKVAKRKANPKKRAKRKVAKRKVNPKKRTKSISKAGFIRRQMNRKTKTGKRFSRKQAENQWTGRRRLRAARKAKR